MFWSKSSSFRMTVYHICRGHGQEIEEHTPSIVLLQTTKLKIRDTKACLQWEAKPHDDCYSGKDWAILREDGLCGK